MFPPEVVLCQVAGGMGQASHMAPPVSTSNYLRKCNRPRSHYLCFCFLCFRPLADFSNLFLFCFLFFSLLSSFFPFLVSVFFCKFLRLGRIQTSPCFCLWFCKCFRVLAAFSNLCPSFSPLCVETGSFILDRLHSQVQVSAGDREGGEGVPVNEDPPPQPVSLFVFD